MLRFDKALAFALALMLLAAPAFAEEAFQPFVGELDEMDLPAPEISPPEYVADMPALEAVPQIQEPVYEPDPYAPAEAPMPEQAAPMEPALEQPAPMEPALEQPAPVEASPEVFPGSLTLGVKERAALNGLALSGGQPVAWVSSKPKVASVDESGVVLARQRGSAVISCLLGEAVLGQCAVTVLKAPKALSFPEKRIVISANQLIAYPVSLSKGSAGAVSYMSDNPAVLAVDVAGNLLGLSGGEATLTAVAYNGKRADCTVRVLGGPAPSWVALSQSTLSLPAKGSFQLFASFDESCDALVTYATSNKKVAVVDEDGTVHAKRAGQASIIATTHNGLTAICEVTVYNAPKKVTLNAKQLTLRVNDGYQLVAALSQNSVSGIAWSSDHPEVVSVDADGLVAALGPGLATITATTDNGKRASCKVTVREAGVAEGPVWDWIRSNDVLEIHFVSVGSVYDDVIILRNSAGAVLIDGGRERSDDRYGRTKVIQDYLSAIGVDRLDYMIGSHLDENHVGVQGWLPDHIPVGAAYYPVDPETAPDKWCESEARRALLHGRGSVTQRVARAGQTRFTLGGMEVCFIGTRQEDFIDSPNSTSIVNLVRYGNNRFMFTGDLAQIGIEAVLAHMSEDAAKFGYPSLKVDVVKWPHHGNCTLPAAFWEATNPSLIVVPNNGKSGVPKSSARSILKRNAPNAEILKLSRCDTITLVSDGSRIEVLYDVDPVLWRR